MSRKIFAFIIIAIAIILAILGMTLPRNNLHFVITITNFFDIMIPILAAGALINYIWKSVSDCCKK